MKRKTPVVLVALACSLLLSAGFAPSALGSRSSGPPAATRSVSYTSHTPSVPMRFLSTSGDGSALAWVDLASGAGTAIGATGVARTYGAAWAPDGTLYGIVDGYADAPNPSTAALATLDPATGAATDIRPPLGFDALPLEIADNGKMYTVGYVTDELYRINPKTGAATDIGPTGINLTMDLAFSPSGVLYATAYNELYTIDTSTGASTDLGAVTGVPTTGDGIMGISFTAGGTLYATTYDDAAHSALLTVDLGTLAATVVGLIGLDRPHGGDLSQIGTRLSIKAPATLAVGARAMIKGKLSPAPCSGSKRVKLMIGKKGGPTATTSVTGAYRFTLKVTKKTTVRVSFAGTAMCRASASAKRVIRTT